MDLRVFFFSANPVYHIVSRTGLKQKTSSHPSAETKSVDVFWEKLIILSVEKNGECSVFCFLLKICLILLKFQRFPQNVSKLAKNSGIGVHFFFFIESIAGVHFFGYTCEIQIFFFLFGSYIWDPVLQFFNIGDLKKSCEITGFFMIFGQIFVANVGA